MYISILYQNTQTRCMPSFDKGWCEMYIVKACKPTITGHNVSIQHRNNTHVISPGHARSYNVHCCVLSWRLSIGIN